MHVPSVKDLTYQPALRWCMTMLSPHLEGLNSTSGWSAARTQNETDIAEKAHYSSICFLYLYSYLCLFLYLCLYLSLFFFIFETWRHSVADILSTSQRTADLGHIVPRLLIWNHFFLLNLLSEIIVPRLFIWNQSLKFMEALHVNSTGGLPSTVIICFESYRVEEGHVGATNHGVAHPGKEGHDCNLKWRQGQEQ